MKHSTFQIANVVRKLSKVNTGVNPAVFSEFLWVRRYVHDNKNQGLKLGPSDDDCKSWETVCFSNNDYRSVSGFILDILKILISWWLKAQ